MKLISCNSNRLLAQKIADRLDMRLTDTEVKTFKDREVFVKVNENVRGQDVYVIQSTSAPAERNAAEGQRGAQGVGSQRVLPATDCHPGRSAAESRDPAIRLRT